MKTKNLFASNAFIMYLITILGLILIDVINCILFVYRQF